MIIIHMQDHSEFNQDATEYGNDVQAHGDAVFVISSVPSRRKCGGYSFLMKEEVCNDGRFAISQVHDDCIYQTHA